MRAASGPLAAAVLVSSLVALPARATPQWNVGVELGACSTGDSFALRRPGYCNALHADVLFLRDGGRDFGIGPALRLGSVRFDDVRLDAGVSLLIPLIDALPLVLEVGPHLRNFDEPGAYASAFFGLRDFNHYGRYEMASGLALTFERTFSAGTPSAIWLTARIDGSWLALPLVLAFNALR